MNDAAARLRNAFDSAALDYDAARRQLVPCFDAFYGALLDALPPPATRPLRILDLGAGTGLVSAMVAEMRPGAVLTLVDLSPDMLDKARQRFRGRAATRFQVSDLARDALPPGPYDTVVSALAIHHLAHADKRALFARIFAALEPGGVFANADQAQATTATADRASHAAWREAAKAAGAGEATLRGALERMKEDRNALLDDQLAWMRQAGFVDVRASFERWFFAVYSGRRPGAPTA